MQHCVLHMAWNTNNFGHQINFDLKFIGKLLECWGLLLRKGVDIWCKTATDWNSEMGKEIGVKVKRRGDDPKFIMLLPFFSLFSFCAILLGWIPSPSAISDLLFGLWGLSSLGVLCSRVLRIIVGCFSFSAFSFISLGTSRSDFRMTGLLGVVDSWNVHTN